MRVSFFRSPIFALWLWSGAASPLKAQEEVAPPAPAPAQNLPERAPAEPSTAERDARRGAQNEQRLRVMMNDFGIESAESQDALISYLAEDETGKSAVRGAARRLMMAVRQGATPERMRDLIAIYKASIDAERERRRAAQSALDAKIGFSLSPRLEAILWLLGVLGEGQSALPFNALTPRPPRNGPGDLAREAKARRGTVRGIVTQKTQGWIEVREGEAAPERYLPFWIETEKRYDPIAGEPLPQEEIARINRAVSETLTRLQPGDRVRLDWVWSGRKRLIRLETLPEELPKNLDTPPVYLAPPDKQTEKEEER